MSSAGVEHQPVPGLLALVVVNYSSSDLLRRNLVPTAEGLTDVLVVVVDNFSSTSEQAQVRALAAEQGWLGCFPAENLGFGGGCNLGVNAALERGADRILLLNPDASIDPLSVNALERVVTAHPLSLTAPRVLDGAGTLWSSGTDLLLDTGDMRSWARRLPNQRHLPWLSGACLLLSAELWRLCGGFDEDYFLYWEDVDLSVRVQRVGGDLVVVEEALAIHDEGGTQRRDAQRAKSPLYYYYNVRNRLVFARKLLAPADRRRWLLTSLRATYRILLRGGRRQFIRPRSSVWPAVRGLAAGLAAFRRGQAPSRSRVRVYESVRSAHLERFHELEPATVYYFSRSYDFAAHLLQGLDVHQVHSLRGLVRALWRAAPRYLEVNEPLMLSAVKSALAAVATVRLRSFLSGRRAVVVSYAIGNDDPFSTQSARLRTPLRRLAFRLMVGTLVRQVDRLVIGTEGAMAEYRPYLGRRRQEVRLVPALPTACSSCELPERGTGVVFLGAFDERKGLRQLLRAWPDVLEGEPSAELTVMGKGPLVDLAEEATTTLAGVSLVLDPDRGTIHRQLSGAKVLVLLSQPSPTWREQVGLPLVEGLSHGCVVVTTDETGIADWLREHQHRVVATVDATDEVIAAAVLEALSQDRSSSSVVADLPPVDGRLAADRWMFEGTSSPEADRSS